MDGYKSDGSDSSVSDRQCVCFVCIVTVKVSWDEDDDNNEVEAPSFPVLIEAIEKSIGQLGGAVFPKLNWSSPRVIQSLFCYEMLLAIIAGCYVGCYGEHFEVYMSLRCHSIAKEFRFHNA